MLGFGCTGTAAPETCPGSSCGRDAAAIDADRTDVGSRDGGADGADRALPPLVAVYGFDEGSGSVANDSSGNFFNAGLVGEVMWGAGRSGSGSDVSFSGGYLVLPPGLLDRARDITLAAWVRLRTDQIWQRVFDFGDGRLSYFFLTPRSIDRTVRFAITRGASTAEQQVEAPLSLAIGVWKHLAVVLGAGGATLYIDGQAVAANPAVVLRPADLTPLTNDWIGRSQYSYDPLLDGEIDDVRIYARALSAAEVLALAQP